MLISYHIICVNHHLRTLLVTYTYTFSVRPKYEMAVLWIFALLICRLFLHIDLPRRLYGRRCRSLGGLVAIL